MAKKLIRVLILALSVSLLAGCVKPDEHLTAVYLGVENYGAPETNRDSMERFRYRFRTEEGETVLSVDNGPEAADGTYSFPIQNRLKEGYFYRIYVRDGRVTNAVEIPKQWEPVETPVSGTPGERTVLNFLRTALAPVGTTLYIYGGGWDWQDEGTAIQCRTIGVSPDWVRFFESRDADYTYKEKDGAEKNADPSNSFYPYGGYNEYYYAGLDCSGYLGWTLYNTFETENGREGYVSGSTGMAKKCADRGWGEWTRNVPGPKNEDAEKMLPGDFLSMNGHVWISLGTCADGSVVIAHSTPSYSRTGQPGGGVQIGAIGPDEDCEAYRLADRIMTVFYPKWSARYETSLKDPELYFSFTGERAGRFSWDVSGNSDGLSDPEGIRGLSPAEVLGALYGFDPSDFFTKEDL